MKMRNRLVLTSLFVAIALPVLLSACNTTAGAGRDLSAAGAAVSDSAEENKGY
jgi:predicted small secreted protein